MRIRHIELENFLSHEAEAVNLPEHGVFFLDAPSGYGKSSFIVDAVLYALFGPKATRGSHEDLKHLDYPDEAMRVKVAFDFADGEVLVVERGTNERNKPFASAYDGQGTLLAEGPKSVGSYIRRRLGGLSWQQLRAAFVCHQKEVAALTDLPPAERKKLVHRLLGIRELEVSQDEVKERSSKARQALLQVEKQVGNRTREAEESRLAELASALTRATESRQETERLLAEASARLASTAKELAPLRASLSAHDQIRELELGLERSRIALEDLESKLARHLAAERLVAGKTDLLRELEAEQARLEELEADGARAKAHADLTSKRVEAAARHDQAKNAVGEVPESPEALEARLVTLGSERQLLEAEQAKRANELHVLDEEGVCITCARPLPEGAERDELLEGLKANVDAVTVRLAAIAAEAGAIEARLPEVRLKAATRRQAELELAKAEESLSGLDAQLQAILAAGPVGEIDVLRDAYKAQREKVKLLEKREDEVKDALKDIDPDLPARVAALTAARKENESELAQARKAAKVAVDRERLAALTSAETSASQEIASLEGQLPLRKEAEASAERELKAARVQMDEFLALLAERETRHTRVLRLESLADYLEAFTKYLATEIRPAIEEMATEMLYQMTRGRFIALQIDENYDIQIQRESGNWIKPSSISGGEEVRANLCLRLALTRLVSQRTGVPVQFIVLDEPFGNLDASLIDVSMGLLDSLRSFYPQIFIISHTGDLQSSQHVDYRLAFDSSDGRGRVKLYQR